MTRFPWGDGPAPALDCHECGRRIGKQRLHFITKFGHQPGRLLCGKCRDNKSLHAKYYPDCPDDWHDMWDHPCHGATTRATAWLILNGRSE